MNKRKALAPAKVRQLADNKTLPGAPAMRAGRMSWVEAQRDKFKAKVGSVGAGRSDGRRREVEEDVCVEEGLPACERRVRLDSERYLTARKRAGTRPVAGRRVVSVMDFSGWSDQELAGVKRAVERWAGMGGGWEERMGVLLGFGFSEGDARRLALRVVLEVA